MPSSSWNRSLTLVLGVIIGIALAPAVATAHGVHISAHAHDGEIHGEAHFLDDTPVANAKVTASDPAGEPIGQATTDAQGQFSLKARFRCDHRLLVDAGGGHGAEYTVRAAELPANLPPRESTADDRGDAAYAEETTAEHPHAQDANTQTPDHDDPEALSHQIAGLQAQLAEHDQKIRLRDVVGGIGYILGLAGVAFYFLGVRRKQDSSNA